MTALPEVLRFRRRALETTPNAEENTTMTESPRHLWIAIWQRQLVNGRP
jgi:hypothetical protein